MRIIFLATGNSVHTIKWINAICGLGHEVFLISQKLERENYNIIDKRVTIKELIFTGLKGYYLNALQTKLLIMKIKPDIINVHYAVGYGILARVAKCKNILLNVWGSDVFEFPYENKLKAYILSKNLRYAKYIASTSYCMAVQVRELLKEVNKPIYITPFGVDVDIFNPNNFINFNKNSKIIIGTVKSLSYKYGIDTIINAFDLLIKDLELKDIYQFLELHIYGIGDQESDLKELVRRLNLESKVYLKGKIPNSEVPRVLSSMSIFCLGSRQESFGVAAVEAMSMELPVIATKANGFLEIIEDGENGLLVDIDDADQMKEAIKLLIFNPVIRKKLGLEGRKSVLKKYNWEKNVKNMENIYLQISENKNCETDYIGR